MKNEHIVISIGTRRDYPPHNHLWCEYCGRYEMLPLPGEIKDVLRFMNGFKKVHKDCVANEKTKIGYLKKDNEYIWGGLLGVTEMATIALNAAARDNNYTDNRAYDVNINAYSLPIAINAIEALIMNPPPVKEEVNWFATTYANALGYENKPIIEHLSNCPGMRMRIFLDVAKVLINSGRRKHGK